MSAFLVSVCTSPPSDGYMAMPMLAVVWHSWPLSCRGWLSTVNRFWAMRSMSSRSDDCSRMTTNSSPPSRATTSLARKVPRSLLAISTSSMSPAS